MGKLKTGEIDFSADFDDMDFGDFDTAIGEKNLDRGKRGVVTDVLKGVRSGIGQEMRSPAFIKRTVRDILPKEYGEVSDVVSEVGKKTAALYDSAMRDVLPDAQNIVRKVDRLAPKNEGIARKLIDKTKRFLGVRDDDERLGGDPESSAVADALREVFGEEREISIKEEARKQSRQDLREVVEKKRWEIQQQSMGGMARDISAIRQYNDRITPKYQQKMLELQTRSYFTLREILRNSIEASNVAKLQGEAITKNTAMPDYLKITKSEAFKERMRNRFFDSTVNGVFGESDIVKVVMGNLKDFVGGVISGFRDTAFAADGILDMAGTVKEMNEAAAEAGMEIATPAAMGGQMLGGEVANWGRGKVAPKLRKLTTSMPGLVNAGKKGLDIATNPFGWLADPRIKDRNTKLKESNSLLERLAGKSGDFLLSLTKRHAVDNRISDGGSMSQLDEPAAGGITNRMQLAMVRAIPGYLARILQAQQQTNGLKDAALLVYDYEGDRFVAKNAFAENVKKRVWESVHNEGHRANLDELIGVMMGKNAKVSSDERTALRDMLITLAKGDVRMTAEDIADTSAFKKLPDDLKDKLLDAMRQGERNEGIHGASIARNRALGRVKSAASRSSAFISDLVKHGSDLDPLIEMGVITRRPDGSTHINPDGLERVMRDYTGELHTSDRNVKHGITRFKPQDALRRLKGMKMFEWAYNGGKKRRVGPMAQDVRQHMGEDVAPGGKAIDAVSMDGLALSAIQALAERMDSGEESTRYLKSIMRSSRRVAGILTSVAKGEIGLGVSPVGAGGAGSWLGRMGDRASDFAEHAYDNTKDFLKNTWRRGRIGFKKAKHDVKRYWDEHGDDWEKRFKKGREALGRGVKRTYKVGKKFLTKKLPKFLGETWGKVSTFAKNLIDDLATMGDIYIKGKMDVPALRAEWVKAGMYFDEKSQMVIKKVSDIKGNIVDENGNIVVSFTDLQQGIVDRWGTPIRGFGEKVMRTGRFLYGVGRKGVSMAVGMLKGGWKKFRENVIDKMGFGFDISFGSQVRQVELLTQIRDLLATGKYNPESGDKGTKQPKHTVPGNALGITPKGMGAGKIRYGRNQTTKPEEVDTSNPGNSDTAVTPRYFAEGATGRMLGALGGFASGVRNAWNGTGGDDFVGPMPRRQSIGEKLNSVRDRFNSRKGGFGGFRGMFGNNGGDFVGSMQHQQRRSMADRMGSGFDYMAGMFGGRGGDFVGPIPRKLKPSERLAELGDKFKAMWNDRNGDGVRDGDSSQTIKERAVNRNRKEMQKTSDEAKYYTQDPTARMMNSVIGTVDFIKDATSRLFGDAGGITDAIAEAGGIETKADGRGGGKGKAKKGGFFSRMKERFGGTTDKAKDALKAAGKSSEKAGIFKRTINGVGKIGSGLWNTAKFGAKAALFMGELGLGVAGTALGVAGSVLATAGSALLTILTSEIVLGAAAIAAVGYGIYRVHKYFTQNKADDYDVLRLYQYGFSNTELDSNHNNQIFALEKYLIDGNISYNNGRASIGNSIQIGALQEIFEIDPEDTEGTAAMVGWFQERFKPFFLTHLTSLYSVDPKVKLTEAWEKLDIAKKQQLMQRVGFESGPYGYLRSPFADIKALRDNREITKLKITAIVNFLTEKGKKEVQEKKDRLLTGSDHTAMAREGIVAKEAAAAKAAAAAKSLAYNNTAPGAPGPGQALVLGEDGAVIRAAGGTYGSIRIPSLVMATGALMSGSSGVNSVKRNPEVKLEGVHPSLLKLVFGMAEEYTQLTGKKIHITRGFASYVDQVLMKQKKGALAATPGKSLHGVGLAVDIDPSGLNECERLGLMRKYGLTRPVAPENWHVEPAGMQESPAVLERCRNDRNYATAVIEASPGKGGGGWGAVVRPGAFGRNWAFAAQTITATASVANGGKTQAPNPKPVVTALKEPKGGTFGTTNTVTKDPKAGSTSKPGVFRSQGEDGDMVRRSSAGFVGGVENASSQGALTQAALNSNAAKVGSIPASKEGMKKLIMDAARRAGGDPNHMVAFAAVESGLDASAGGGGAGARGLMQFLPGTWSEQMGKHARRLGLTGNEPPEDPVAATMLAVAYGKEMQRQLGSTKPNMNVTDMYLCHMLGAGGAKKLFSVMQSTPNVTAASVFPGAAKERGNRSMFFDQSGRAFTVTEFYQNAAQRVKSKAASVGVNIDTGANTVVGGNTPIGGGIDYSRGDVVVSPNRAPAPAGLPPSRVQDRGGAYGGDYGATANAGGYTPGNQGGATEPAQRPAMSPTYKGDFGAMQKVLADQLAVQIQIRDLLAKNAGVSTKSSGQSTNTTSKAESVAQSTPPPTPTNPSIGGTVAQPKLKPAVTLDRLAY